VAMQRRPRRHDAANFNQPEPGLGRIQSRRPDQGYARIRNDRADTAPLIIRCRAVTAPLLAGSEPVGGLQPGSHLIDDTRARPSTPAAASPKTARTAASPSAPRASSPAPPADNEYVWGCPSRIPQGGDESESQGLVVGGIITPGHRITVHWCQRRRHLEQRRTLWPRPNAVSAKTHDLMTKLRPAGQHDAFSRSATYGQPAPRTCSRTGPAHSDLAARKR